MPGSKQVKATPWLNGSQRQFSTKLLLALLCLHNGAAPAADFELFEKFVRPLLTDRCVKCHGPEKQKGGLRLDSGVELMKGGDDGPVIVPGKSSESKLIRLVSGLDPEKVMPPRKGGGDPLTVEQINLLKRWIDDGAQWPAEPKIQNPKSKIQNPDHWAFKPPQLPAVPPVKSQRWVRNSIDQFILARLEQKGLSPAPEADRRTLIRRLSFDLPGLPPTPEEVEAFAKDMHRDAYEVLVDRLLSSLHYGERQARHWLDLARFCESHGFEYDKPRDNAWPYRDYVIRSFNDNKPYTQFIKEQLAGDVLEPLTRDGIVGASFLTVGTWDEVGHNQVGQLMKARVREEELEDIISVVGQTFLGVTINCARCHAHKFDPIPHSDYYRVKAVFEGVRYGERPILTPAEMQTRSNHVAQLNERIRGLQKQIAEIEQAAYLAIVRQRAPRSADPSSSSSIASARLPVPLAKWTFDTDANDSVGSLHGSLQGGASLAKGRLLLNGKDAYVRTAPLPSDVREKTLETWLTLSDLKQRGGAAISIESKDGATFDAIVFGERQPRKWMAGSSYFQRTKDLAAADEVVGPTNLIHVAIVYRSDNSIAVYRNGVPYAEPYTSSGNNATLRTFPAQESHLLIGLRHPGAGNGFLAGEIEEARLYDRALSPEEVHASFSAGVTTVSSTEILQAMTEDQRQQRDKLFAELQSQQAALKAMPPLAMAYAGTRQQPSPTHRLIRGDVEKKAEVVTAGALSAVAKPVPDFGLPADAPEAERRRAFANWVASAENPLTARVIVNRVWQQHFGTGLVGTPSDFGMNGERPSHPELLDWLAQQFIEEGWNLKKLHRLIVTSATYRQSSRFNAKAAALDADNRLLWHFVPRRLEGEAVRDAMLAVSGQLNREIGGPSFRPFETESFGSVFYKLTDPEGPPFNRRTIYRMNINSGKSPLLDALDCPDPSFKTPLRRVTTTPLQALGLMNNSFVQRQAKLFAARVAHEAGLFAQVTQACQLALGHRPSAEHAARAIALAREHGLEQVCWALLNSSEFLYVR